MAKNIQYFVKDKSLQTPAVHCAYIHEYKENHICMHHIRTDKTKDIEKLLKAAKEIYYIQTFIRMTRNNGRWGRTSLKC